MAQKLSNLKIFDSLAAHEIQFQKYFGHCNGNTEIYGENRSSFDRKIHTAFMNISQQDGDFYLDSCPGNSLTPLNTDSPA